MAENMNRRAVLGTALVGGGALLGALSGCAADEPLPNTRPKDETGATTLVVYFSRAGENYYNGGRRDLQVGNTEVLAMMIRDRIKTDVYRILEAEPYPESYDNTVKRNAEEQNTNARPAIAGPLPELGRYTTVLLGSPVWNVRAPMILSTFLDAVDLSGKTVLPFVSYAVSGMGSVEAEYRASLPTAEVRTGLAVRGELVAESAPAIEAWLRQSGLGT
ncbi:hypothetical protein CGQ24_02780 [Arthrobacter sp. 7749]|nr:hypothetical protein CGQ24_02780 [Arthrobacter sp. 7749]